MNSHNMKRMGITEHNPACTHAGHGRGISLFFLHPALIQDQTPGQLIRSAPPVPGEAVSIVTRKIRMDKPAFVPISSPFTAIGKNRHYD